MIWSTTSGMTRPAERGLNASLALNWLAHRCVDGLAGRIGLERTRVIGNLIGQGILDACAGEDLDIVLETATGVSEDLAHEMKCRKSGPLIAMVCQVGAAVATDYPEISRSWVPSAATSA